MCLLKNYYNNLHSCAVHLDTIRIYPTDVQLDCSIMLKSALKFTREVLVHVLGFHNHHQGATVCALLKL